MKIVAGVTLASNTMVRLVIGSANRDERAFADPDRFDITRPDLKETAIPYGAGIHTCIGAPLVAVTAPLAIGRLVAELPNMTLDTDSIVTWQTDPYLRAPASLPLSI